MATGAWATGLTVSSDSLWGKSQNLGLEWLLNLDQDRLLAPYYTAMGKDLPAGVKPYGGWESRQIAGHSLGHELSALAGFWRATHDPRVRARLDRAVAILGKLQRKDGYLGGLPSTPFDQVFTGDFDVEAFSLAGWWVPWYNIHKTYAGLIAAATEGETPAALPIVTKMADWAVKGLSKMTDAEIQRMLRCEHGGMVQVFADLSAITGNKTYLKMAERLVHHEVIDPLAQGKDSLAGLHANTQIPKLLGVARLYELTGKAEYRRAVETFFGLVSTTRTYPIGGNSLGEHFGRALHLDLGRDTAETCNTYNMQELAEHLFAWTGDSQYTDFYERAQINHILASQDPETGAKTYFVSTDPGHFKVYCDQEDSFWCCTGTGMENPERYGRIAWSRRDAGLYLNLFLPGTYQDKGTQITVKTAFPEGQLVELNVVSLDSRDSTLWIRKPWWVDSNQFSVNRPVLQEKAGYVQVAVQAGQSITVELPFVLRAENLEGNPLEFSYLWGPVVLAGEDGTEGFPGTDIVGDHLSLMNWKGIEVPGLSGDGPRESWVEKTPSGWQVKAGVGGANAIRLLPFYALHHERYTVIFRQGGDNAAESRDQKYQTRTIDVVKAGEQQSEIEHGYQGKRSFRSTVEAAGLHGRDARGATAFFAYTMVFDPHGCELLVAFAGLGETGPKLTRDFQILVDGKPVAHIQTPLNTEQALEEVRVTIGPELLAGLQPEASGKIPTEVRFEPLGEGSWAGIVAEVRTLTQP